MPTPNGGETIKERRERLNIELARVRATIARVENNGSSFSMGGKTVTQAAYESALRREKSLQSELANLARRLGGGAPESVGQTVTKIQN